MSTDSRSTDKFEGLVGGIFDFIKRIAHATISLETAGIQNPDGNDPIRYPLDQPVTSRLTEADKRKRKQESDKKCREKKKKKMEENDKQVKRLEEERAYYKGKVDALEKLITERFGEKLADSFKKAVELEGITAKPMQSWQLPGGGALGSTSAVTEEVAYPPLELSVTAKRSDGSITSEPFALCQALPEEWNQLATGQHGLLIRAFFGLKEHYTASTERHAQEIAELREELSVDIDSLFA
ncbi:unnamed protein product [Dovyalis caffra]|uniref:Uncharacterized protein n=1 Tax=Dovyalis caffra TaxID=77055 RepID=A0AAV1QTL8_9ROSI|nr:unnamed protein product [Dovyalis caffra]